MSLSRDIFSPSRHSALLFKEKIKNFCHTQRLFLYRRIRVARVGACGSRRAVLQADQSKNNRAVTFPTSKLSPLATDVLYIFMV